MPPSEPPRGTARGAQVLIRKEGNRVTAEFVGDLGAADLLLGLELMRTELLERARAGAAVGSGRPARIQARRADAPAEG